MAMKNWVKIDSGAYSTSWKNKSNRDVVRAFYRKNSFFYDVKNRDGYVLFEKETNSKSKALRLSKSYMRKN